MFRTLLALSAGASALMPMPDAAELLAQHSEATTLDLKTSLGASSTPSSGVHHLVQPKLCDPSVQQHAGTIAFKNSKGQANDYFFYLFEAREVPPKDAPLVVWMTGGPGCSSAVALFAENGPCTVEKDGKATKINEHSWHRKANVLWLDQPAGVGFSEGVHIHDENHVGDNVYSFLKAFYKALPQYAENKLTITGESYGGHYIPAVAHAIFRGNKDVAQTGDMHVPLEGIAIGNGLTDPGVQYLYYAEMALNGGKSEGGSLVKGVMGTVGYTIMRAGAVPCAALIKNCNAAQETTLFSSKLGAEQSPAASAVCTAAFFMCNLTQMLPFKATMMNPYDMRIKCEHGNLCYDFSHISTFLNSKAVKQELGVSKQWESCNMVVNMQFRDDWMRNMALVVPELLEGGVRTLIYAGDVDFICNWLGNKHWVTEAVNWSGASEFAKADDGKWTVDGKAAGRVRVHKNLAFAQVYQAGHMVPMDQPAVAANMIESFLAGGFPGDKREEVTM